MTAAAKATAAVTVIDRRLPRSLRGCNPSGKEKAKTERFCRMCLRPSHVRPLTRHHIVPLAWWRFLPMPHRALANATANIIPLCRGCHDDVESRDPALRREARRECRVAMTQAEVTFAIAVRGKQWFDHHYPPTP